MERIATWLAYILDTPARQAKRRLEAYYASTGRGPDGRQLPRAPLTKEEEEEEWRQLMALVKAEREERERDEREREERARRESANGRAA